MIAFIDDNRAIHGVEPICRVLPVAPSTYRAQVAQRADPAKGSMRVQRDARLCSEICRVFEANFGASHAALILLKSVLKAERGKGTE